MSELSHAVVLHPELLPRSAPVADPTRGPRLVREVCREGRWFVGGDPVNESAYYTITPALNRQIVETWAQREEAGIRCPLQRDHSTDGIHTASPNVVLYWDECWLEDGFPHGSSVFCGCYPGPRLDELVQEPCPVSPDIQRQVVDGTGKVWPVVMMHVALVDHATIPRQNGFVQMALAESSVVSKSQEEKKTMDFAKFVESINQLLGVIKPGLALPETVDEASFDSVFSMVLKMVGAEETAEDDGDGADSEDAADVATDASEGDPVSMSLKSLTKEVAKLKAMVGVSLSLGGNSAKERFTGEVDAMVSNGFPAGSRGSLLALGKAGGWNVSDLDEFKAMPGLSLSLQSTGIKHKPLDSRGETVKAWRDAGLSEEAIARQSARLLGGE
ncbi:hypothetical protein UFOVP1004_28 [uncultured Caudovirales phage]|uniref:Uncharacterized protein n=1 Tax=uncultured Caudovirales phage TaxID=2100421 RepID=A0A6J5QDS9_9CAUD|nr:hypothetical protein UFOVP1004_28 [uncultured Caudovirales phage]